MPYRPPTTGARFDDALDGSALVFTPPSRVLVARRPGEVRPLLAELDRVTSGGAWAFGYLAYEAAPGLDPGLAVHAPPDPGLLAWFGVGRAPQRAPLIAAPSGPRPYHATPWRPATTAEQHSGAVQHIRDEIAAGGIYQANLTARLHATVRGDLTAMYADLVHAQQASYNALLDLGTTAVVSASPELFLEWAGGVLRCRPMKGTARRGTTPDEDRHAAAALVSSGKDVAENVMIVDLVRNDLGRIGRTGTVRVPRLGVCEPFAQVWQLSSEVEAEPRDGVGIEDVLGALFPSGSITGTPKQAATHVIAQLEGAPRGVYCGAIGWVAPPDEPVRARFSVAIRTAVIDRESGSAVYGAGGGITIGSEPAAEYRELLDKAAVLDATQDEEPLQLLETLGCVGGVLQHVERHLDRVRRSAAYFGIPFDRAVAQRTLAAAAAGKADARLRLRVAVNGVPAVDLHPFPAAAERPVRLAVDRVPVDAASLWLAHKTNRRGVYDAARARHPGADDVLLVNGDGHVTESCIANVLVCLDGRWWTPPTADGCLPGVGRAVALDGGEAAERSLTVDDLRRAEAIELVNSLRGRRPAVLLP